MTELRDLPARPGESIAGRFVVEALAGEGGMGVVYRALDRATGRHVAIKLIASDRAQLAARFDRESSVLASLSHPHIVGYVAHGADARYGSYLAMEWLQGESLSDRLDRGRLGLSEGFEVGVRIAGALAAAHRHGVVHRDVKPSNVFLVGGDVRQLKLLDFGIARRAGLTVQTATGHMLGTVGFMAPEQAGSGREITYSADVFSLGAVLYYAFTGFEPFQGKDPMAILMSLAKGRIRSPRALRPSLPPAMEALLLEMLRSEPAQRPEHGGVVEQRLMSLAGAIAAASTSPDPGPMGGPNIPEVSLHAPGTEVPAGLPAAHASLPTDEFLKWGPNAAAHGPTVAASPLGTTPPAARRDATTAPKKSRRRLGLVIGASVVCIGAIGAVVGVRIIQDRTAKPKKAAKRPATTASASSSSSPPAVDTSQEGLRLFWDRSTEENTARAIIMLRSACEAGFRDGCAGLALAAYSGVGLPKDEAGAAKLLRQGCDTGSQVACVGLGEAHESGVGAEKNQQRTFELYDQACKTGYQLGCAMLGHALEDGIGVLKDHKRASELYSTACDAGTMRGCSNLGFILIESKVLQRDEQRAAELFQKACNGGDVRGCSGLGSVYLVGTKNVAKDEQRAFQLFDKACKQGYFSACQNQALCYFRGLGTTPDPKKGSDLLQGMCDSGNATACSNLGRFYGDGEGVPKDKKRAIELYEKGCNGGVMTACDSLGVAYVFGDGVTKDQKRGADLCERACREGGPKHCSNIGALLVRGIGVPMDRNRGIDMLRLACNAGEETACENLRAVGAKP